jgi:threonine synthase
MDVLRCQGCGLVLGSEPPTPFRCPRSGDGGDHVLGRTLEAGARFPEGLPTNSFLHYRTLTHAYAVARSHAVTDDAFVQLVQDLDRAVGEIDGHGFWATPFERSAALSTTVGLSLPGGVWVKDETGNVAGSHKGRHLMGLAILAAVEARVDAAAGKRGKERRLAIASCGNAALAAAVIAAAAKIPLDVFIPSDANPKVVARVDGLGATVHVCSRDERIHGDPCYRAFRDAVEAGAVPFCCQGSDNGLTIEGGETLAWEVIAELHLRGIPLDRAFVQVGGGALASAWVLGFRDAMSLGASVALPRLHPVQTRGAFPLRRAWERVVAQIAERLGLDRRAPDDTLAESIRKAKDSRAVADAFDYAARHRSDFMWPWETTPTSIAHGILDDETYDWLAVVRGTIDSGGFPIVVDEARLEEANAIGRDATGIDADATGTAGLAGLLELCTSGTLAPKESVAVLFTGVRR